MRFRYLSLPLEEGSLSDPRPLLRTSVIGQRGQGRSTMLVDSGADSTLLPLDFLLRIGARFTGETLHVSSFAADVGVGKIAEVRIQFGGGRFGLASKVVGLENLALPVLGHRDFFLRYYVAFDAGRNEFLVAEPRR